MNMKRKDKAALSLQNIERVCENLGITTKALQEFTPANMSAFNDVCEDAIGVDYFSMGAQKPGKVMNIMLQEGWKMINNEDFGATCDGIVMDEEARWGNYLITWENDHLEVMGFTPGHNPANVLNLVADNTRIAELRAYPDLAYEYGVDKLY